MYIRVRVDPGFGFNRTFAPVGGPDTYAPIRTPSTSSMLNGSSIPRVREYQWSIRPLEPTPRTHIPNVRTIQRGLLVCRCATPRMPARGKDAERMQRDTEFLPLSFSSLTPILTRLRCAHLGVTRSFVQSFRSFIPTDRISISLYLT